MAMANKKPYAVMILTIFVVAFLFATSEGARGLGATQLEPLADVGELPLAMQDQVDNLDQENMEAAKRRLLNYDPYYNKWYGGKQ
ncbi:hypothetical protein KP509_20G083300 [Ceratopteris richardii]|uniref:Uncharacterized protein n=3 Tax=Ceratopteris richardii TaxID=49495 RepID=A0A8T2SKD3_CERRI|nr:hypothetical protein KP509_20G083300 [Ceratopteris richardii]